MVWQDAQRIERQLQESQRDKSERKHAKDRTSQTPGKASLRFLGATLLPPCVIAQTYITLQQQEMTKESQYRDQVFHAAEKETQRAQRNRSLQHLKLVHLERAVRLGQARHNIHNFNLFTLLFRNTYMRK